MKQPVILLFILFCCLHGLQAQKKHADKHILRPGLSFGYLPTWFLDDFDGNTSARVFMSGVYGHQEIWKESVFTLGVVYGRLYVKNINEHSGIIVPVKLQKFFTPDRKGFNLSFGVLMDYCKTCGEGIGGAISQEISYMFSNHPVQVNAGMQILEGELFGDQAIHVGGQVQLIWHPQVRLDK